MKLKNILALALLAVSARALALVPNTLNYQGRMRSLTTGAAVADSTTNSATFRLYTVATAGSPVWSETQTSITTTAGLFNVVLGSANALSVPFDQQYYLEIVWNSPAEVMSPRTPLTAGPYAFRAKALDMPYAEASTVGGNTLIFTQNLGSGIGTGGIFGRASAGYGVKGSGVTGVAAIAESGGIGLVADQGTGDQALKVLGGARFSGPSSVSFVTVVDFSAATITGWNVPASVSAPLSLTLSSGGSAPLSVSNGAGYAASFVGMSGIALSTDTLALSVTSKSSDSGAVYVRGSTPYGLSTFTNDGGGSAVMAYAVGGNGIYAQSVLVNGIYGQSLGSGWAGIAGSAQVAGAYGVKADNYLGGTALYVTGGAKFFGSTTIAAHVDFSGATVTGWNVPANVVAPLSLTLSSVAGAPLSVSNATGAAGYYQGLTGLVVAVDGQGLSVTSKINNGNLVTVRGSTTQPAMKVENDGTGSAFQAQASSNIGVAGYSSSGTGVWGEAFSGSGVGVSAYATLTAKALVARQVGATTGVAISATAVGANGQAIYGRVSSAAATAEFVNDNASGTPLKVNGQKFPTTDSGFSGRVLSTDGAGNLTWTALGGTLFGGTVGAVPYFTSAASLGNSGMNWDNVNSRLGLGVPTAPLVTLHVGNATAGSAIFNDAAGGGFGSFTGRGAQGTLAAPASTLAGDTLASFGGRGYGLGTYSTDRAAMRIRAEENWGAVAQGTSIGFFTTSNGSNTQVERLTLDNIGNVGIGTTSPGAQLDLNGAFNVRGLAAPGAAAGGQGKIYFDSATNKFMVSENGSAFTNLAATAPMVLSGTAAFPNGVLTVTNNGDGSAVVGYATTPGGFSGGGAPTFASAVSSGLKGYTNVTNSAGVAGFSQITLTSGLGVIGLGYTGVGGYARTDAPGSRGGDFSSDSMNGIGVAANAQTGTAGTFNGLTGAVISGSQMGLIVTGGARINGLRYPTSDGTANHVLKTDGLGNLSFGPGGASAPMSLTSVAAVTALNVANTFGGEAIYASAATSGYGIESQNSGSGPAVAGINTSSGGTGVFGYISTPTNNGNGVIGQNQGGANTGAGVKGINSSGSGFGIYGVNTGGTAMLAEGGSLGLSVTATSGRAIYAAGSPGFPNSVVELVANGTGYGIYATKADPGSSSGAVIYAENSAGTSGYAVAANLNNGTNQSAAINASVSGGHPLAAAIKANFGPTIGGTGMLNGAGILSTNDQPNGIGVYAKATHTAGSKAMIAQGGSIGLSATANSSSGSAVFASASSTQPTGIFANEGVGTGLSVTSVVTGVYSKVTALGSTAIYAESTSGSLSKAITAIGAYMGISAVATSSSAVGVAAVYAHANSGLNPGYGVEGRNSGGNSGNAGVSGWGFTGVIGDSFGTSGYGVMGKTTGTGAAVYGNSTGTGPGVIAAGTTLGLSVTGGAFYSSGKSVTFAGHVNFGGVVTGFSVAAPLSLTLGSSTSTMSLSNTLSGRGLYVSAVNSGTSQMAAIYAQGGTAGLQTFGIHGRVSGNAGGSAGVLGMMGNPVTPSAATFPNGAGVMGFGANSSFGGAFEGYIGAWGKSTAVSGWGLYGQNYTAANTSGGVNGQNAGASSSGDGVTGDQIGNPNTGAGVRGNNNSGTGYGVIANNSYTTAGSAAIGLSATSLGATGIAGYFQAVTAIVASGSALGLSVTGGAFYSSGKSVTFAGHVNFGGAVTGINVVAPLNLTSSSVAAALYAHNSTGGIALSVSGVGNGGALTSRNTGGGGNSYGALVIANNGLATPRAGLVGSSSENFTNPSGAVGVYGYSTNTAGVSGFMDAVGNVGAGVKGENSIGSGYGVLAVNSAVSGSMVALSATSNGGTAVYANTNSSAPTIVGLNAGSGPSGSFSGGTGNGVIGSTAGNGAASVQWAGVKGQYTGGGTAEGFGIWGVASTANPSKMAGVYGEFGSPAMPSFITSGGGAGAGVAGVNGNAGAGIGVYGQALGTGGIAVLAKGGAVGLSATASGVWGMAMHASSSNSGPGSGTVVVKNANVTAGNGVYASGVTGVAASGNAVGVVATGGMAGLMGYGENSDAMGVYGYAADPNSWGVVAYNPNGGGTNGYPALSATSAATDGIAGYFQAVTGVVVASSAIGISVTSSGGSSSAIVGQSASTAPIIVGRNDLSGAIGIQGIGTGIGYGIQGSVATAASGGVGVRGVGGTTTGVSGVEGQATGAGSYGVRATNNIATTAGGGAALQVTGLIRVNQTSTTANAATSITMTANGPHVRLDFTSGGPIQYIFINNTAATVSSTAMVSFGTANMPTAAGVRVGLGTISILLTSPLTVSATERMNVLVINP